MLRQQAAQSPQLTRTQQVDLRRLRALQEQARRAEAVRKAQADANRRLQEALEALAKALSSSSCTTVGGQNGTAASISCPLDNGGTGTVTGGGGTSVTPAPTTSPTPTPSPSATGQALTAASLPDAPVGPEDALTEGRLADALAQAKGEWADAGGDVSGITASIEDLSGATLGRSSGSSVVVDTDAAGWGWSQMSLVTVVRHEIGHVLGLDHTDGGLMDETLAPGQERGVGSAPALPHAEEPAPPADETPAEQPTQEPAAEPEPAPADEAATDEPATDTAPEPTDGDATTGSTDGTAAGDPTDPAAVTGTDTGPRRRAPTPRPGRPAPTRRPPRRPARPPAPPPRRPAPARAGRRPTARPAISFTGNGTVTYDADTGTVRVRTGDTTADLAAHGLVRIVIESSAGTVVVTGTIRLTSTGFVIRARDIVVTNGSTIDTTGAAGDGDISLLAGDTATGTDTSSSASVTVRGATLNGGNLTLAASASTTGTAYGNDAEVRGTSSARVLVLDSALLSSGDVTLGSTSRAQGSATAVGSRTSGDLTADAARATVLLASLAETRLGGSSHVVARGALSVLATNETDARSVGDASDAAAGAGTATAAVDRTTRAVVDGTALGGLRVGRLGIDATSSGRLYVSSEGNAAGASSNTTPPISLTGAARTTDGAVGSAAALGLGRVTSLTEAILASGDGQVLTLNSTGDARVTARSTDSSMVAADAAASALGAAVAVVIPTTTTHATVGGSVVLDGGVLLVRSDLTDDATARATGGRGGALAVALGSRRSSADLAAGSSLRGHLDAVTLGAGSATSTTGTSSRTRLGRVAHRRRGRRRDPRRAAGRRRPHRHRRPHPRRRVDRPQQRRRDPWHRPGPCRGARDRAHRRPAGYRHRARPARRPPADRRPGGRRRVGRLARRADPRHPRRAGLLGPGRHHRRRPVDARHR